MKCIVSVKLMENIEQQAAVQPGNLQQISSIASDDQGKAIGYAVEVVLAICKKRSFIRLIRIRSTVLLTI